MSKSALLAAPKLIERTYPGKPMSLDYLAGVLLAQGFQVSILDVDVVGINVYEQALRSNCFDLIGITAMSIQVDQANELATLARELNPTAAVIRGGAHDTFSFEKSCATHPDLYDAFAVGEGESTIREIAQAVLRGSFKSERSSISGLAFWEGSVKFTGRRQPVDVNTVAPFRGTHHGSYDFDVFGGLKTAQVLGSRGCANACFYCSESVSAHGRKEFRRTISHLSEELRSLKTQGYKAVYFDDPTFTRDRDWALQLCEELRRFGFTWGCNTRVDCLDEELVFRMHQSGCEYLFCGLESAVPEVLRGINKTNDPGKYLDHAVRAYKSLKQNGLPCSAFLIFGCPKMEKIDGEHLYSVESRGDVWNSLDFAINTLDPDYLSMNILRLLPGLPLSFAPQFKFLRPDGVDSVHGGHYDGTWYQQVKRPDLRSNHPIYRAFEGCGSVNPPHLTVDRCYEILSLAVEMVNSKNAKAGTQQTRIVVDRRFDPFLEPLNVSGSLRYRLATITNIERQNSEPAPVRRVA